MSLIPPLPAAASALLRRQVALAPASLEPLVAAAQTGCPQAPLYALARDQLLSANSGFERERLEQRFPPPAPKPAPPPPPTPPPPPRIRASALAADKP